MKKILASLFLAAVACGCLVSCNEKPKHYQFVKVTTDGQELVEEITAKNDTDALKLYLDRMEKILVENMDKPDQQQYKVMYIISPSGDTLNTNEQLLQSIVIPTATAQ